LTACERQGGRASGILSKEATAKSAFFFGVAGFPVNASSCRFSARPVWEQPDSQPERRRQELFGDYFLLDCAVRSEYL
jgi:hypothetical protein